ncbi:MAG: phytanoyl-CoA dioxygenase family protein [Pseudomonadota bacterium]
MDPIRDYIDTARYPIDGDCKTLVSATFDQLMDDGCAVLPGFVRADRIGALIAEADAVADQGWRNFNRTNAYFTKDDPSLPASHPLRRFYDRSNSFVPADNFGPESILRRLYEWPPFTAFVKAALGEENFYRYADPLADVIINQAEEGGGFPWHFDTNNYTVTLAIQNADEGGAFEYVPQMRTSTDECYEEVEAVLDERSPRVKSIDLQPGDLQIFKGRYALHRVTPLKGPTPRYVGIFSFVEYPGMVATPERCRQLYGRVLPIHLERAGQRADALID